MIFNRHYWGPPTVYQQLLTDWSGNKRLKRRGGQQHSRSGFFKRDWNGCKFVTLTLPALPHALTSPLSYVPQGDKLIDDNEWSFLISGKTYTPIQAGENPAPEWVDARMWSEVQAVAGLSAFEGLAESFAGPLLQDFKVIIFTPATLYFAPFFVVSKAYEQNHIH